MIFYMPSNVWHMIYSNELCPLNHNPKNFQLYTDANNINLTESAWSNPQVYMCVSKNICHPVSYTHICIWTRKCLIKRRYLHCWPRRQMLLQMIACLWAWRCSTANSLLWITQKYICTYVSSIISIATTCVRESPLFCLPCWQVYAATRA